MARPLEGLRVVELAGIGPGPHACMVLGDLGADVVRVDRKSKAGAPGVRQERDAMLRGRRIVTADLRNVHDRNRVLELIKQADVMVEGFRPGVAEKLGLGPDECTAENPKLIYGRMTGWGRSGPLAERAGHDINYLSVTGVLDNLGRADDRPVPPLNLVGDFGGGSMFLVVGILAALWEREHSGQGQVVDAAMVDGIGVLSQMVWSLRSNRMWSNGRGENFLDGSAPFYDTYECGDGRYVAVGPIEAKFYAELIDGLGLADADIPQQWDRPRWPELRAAIADVFASRTRDEWAEAFLGTDACVTPVLDYDEALSYPHHEARTSFATVDGVVQPAPAPRFSRSDLGTPDKASAVDGGIDGVLLGWATP